MSASVSSLTCGVVDEPPRRRPRISPPAKAVFWYYGPWGCPVFCASVGSKRAEKKLLGCAVSCATHRYIRDQGHKAAAREVLWAWGQALPPSWPNRAPNAPHRKMYYSLQRWLKPLFYLVFYIICRRWGSFHCPRNPTCKFLAITYLTAIIIVFSIVVWMVAGVPVLSPCCVDPVWTRCRLAIVSPPTFHFLSAPPLVSRPFKGTPPLAVCQKVQKMCGFPLNLCGNSPLAVYSKTFAVLYSCGVPSGGSRYSDVLTYNWQRIFWYSSHQICKLKFIECVNDLSDLDALLRHVGI